MNCKYKLNKVLRQSMDIQGTKIIDKKNLLNNTK